MTTKQKKQKITKEEIKVVTRAQEGPKASSSHPLMRKLVVHKPTGQKGTAVGISKDRKRMTILTINNLMREVPVGELEELKLR